MVSVRLNGFFPADFQIPERVRGPVGAPTPFSVTDPVEIGDARALQDDAGVSEAAFFAEHGFVLLPHASACRNWDADVVSTYMPEVERVIRDRLFPGRRIEVELYPNLLRRGRDTPVPFYAEGVHSDGGIGADDYAHNIGAFAGEPARDWWRKRYDSPEVAGMVWVDLWRVTNMAAPLEHMPLALCDMASLSVDDLVPTGLTGIAPEGRETHHTSLRFNAGQRWYHYPRMTVDELLAFKLAEFRKDRGHIGNVFHSAFAHPDAPADAEQRQSCEYRVGVLIMRD